MHSNALISGRKTPVPPQSMSATNWPIPLLWP